MAEASKIELFVKVSSSGAFLHAYGNEGLLEMDFRKNKCQHSTQNQCIKTKVPTPCCAVAWKRASTGYQTELLGHLAAECKILLGCSCCRCCCVFYVASRKLNLKPSVHEFNSDLCSLNIVLK